jgi:hypothetical protein
VIFLEWWVYPLIGTTVFASMMAAYRLEAWRERRESGPEFPFGPCLAYLGTTEDEVMQYCGRLDGHEEDCGGEIIPTFPQPVLAPVRDTETTEFGYVRLDPGESARPYFESSGPATGI